MTVWQRFRVWRRSRPFWGGVLTVLAGLEIIGSMNLELHGGTISIGQEGFTAYLIAFVLMITGPLAWFMPVQRHFYGLVAVFVAIYSLLGVNLGGFFLGMLLGVIGGGLIFAWSPAADPGSGATASAAHDTTASPDAGIEAGDEEADPKVRSPRHTAMIIIAVALSLSMATLAATPGRAGAAPCSPAAAKPATTSASPAPAQSGGSGGSLIGGVLDLLGRLLGGSGGSATPTASETPAPPATPSPPVSPSPSPCPSPSQTGPSAGPTPTRSAPGTTPSSKPSGKPTPSPSPTKAPAKVLPVAAGQPNVAKRPSRMTGSVLVMHNLLFDGVVELPTVDGTIRVLRFSMTQADTSDFLLHVYGRDGWDIDLHSSKLTVQGEKVFFYASRFRGKLEGLIPVDYTPDNPPPLPPIPLPVPVFFTDVDVQLVWVQSPELKAPNLRTVLVRSEERS